MAQIKRFEDLIIWQKARLICQKVYILTKKSGFSNDFELIKQCRRSSGSIMDNIAEGYERDGNKEFIQFLSIAKGSCGELRSQIYRAFDNQYISQEEFDMMMSDTLEESRMIQGFINTLKNTDFKGNKYKIN